MLLVCSLFGPGLLFGLRGEGSFTANAVLAKTALSFTLTLAIDELAETSLSSTDISYSP